MRNLISFAFVFTLVFAAYLSSGISATNEIKVGGDPPCDVTNLNDYPCNNYLPGCFGSLRLCHTAPSGPTALCDVAGGVIKCNNYAEDPDCLGKNEDSIDGETPCIIEN